MNLFGYLDPGTGSMVLQVIIGAVVSVGVVLKAYGAKIRRLFGGGKKASASTSQADAKTNDTK